MKQMDMRRISIMIVVVITVAASLLLSGCSGQAAGSGSAAGSDTNVEKEVETVDPWKHFGEINKIGKTVQEIEDELGLLEAIGSEGGGMWYQSEAKIKVAFPYVDVYSGEDGEIKNKTAKCTGIAGYPDLIFGMKADATMEEVEAALELTLEENPMADGSYIQSFKYEGYQYGIQIYPYDEPFEGHNCSIAINGSIE